MVNITFSKKYTSIILKVYDKNCNCEDPRKLNDQFRILKNLIILFAALNRT